MLITVHYKFVSTQSFITLMMTVFKLKSVVIFVKLIIHLLLSRSFGNLFGNFMLENSILIYNFVHDTK